MSLPIWDDSIDDQENYIRTKLGMDYFTSASVDDQWSQLRDIGFTITREEYRNIWRDTMDIVRHQAQIRELRPETPIPLSYMDYVPTWNLSRDYQYHFKYTYEREVTNPDGTISTETGTRYYSFGSDVRYSKEELEQEIQDQLGDLISDESDIVLEVLSSELVGVYRKTKG